MSSLMGNYARDGNLAVAAGSSVKHHDPAVTVSSLMERYMLTEATCNREITEEFIASISQSFCDDWRKLPGILRVRMNVVDEMENKYRNDEWMCKIGFFRYWKRSIGPDATYEVLIGALLKIDCMGDAHSVCKLLQESAPVCTQQPVSTPSPKGIYLYLYYPGASKPCTNNHAPISHSQLTSSVPVSCQIGHSKLISCSPHSYALPTCGLRQTLFLRICQLHLDVDPTQIIGCVTH